jgi:hypothetical protein
MITKLNIIEAKILWVIGALERLATLGFLDKDVPYKVNSNAIDDFILIDEYRHEIFVIEDEIAQIFKAMIGADNVTCSDDDIQPIVDLILQYKNNRTEMVKHALSQ